MGKKQSRGDEARPSAGLDAFEAAVRRQLVDKQRLVRAFDVGGSGVKTALVSALALREFLHPEGAPLPEDAEELPSAWEELQWIEPPNSLGEAPGEAGFAAWLLEAVPRLKREVDDPQVCFGVSIGGDVDHASGKLRDWWPGGGHPRSWDDGRADPLVSELMGLPAARTFVLHDGEAHILGCSRRVTPPPNLGCFALGTGVGFGLSDDSGQLVDPSSMVGERSHCLSGVPLSGAPYQGIWKQWLERADCDSERVAEVMARPYANMSKPWRTTWTSLLLGRRGMELSEAAHGSPAPRASPGAVLNGEDEARVPAVRAFGEQWLHFLYTQFLPSFARRGRHRVARICFGGGVAEHNWPALAPVLLDDAGALRPAPAATEVAAPKRGRAAKSRASIAEVFVTVLPPAPCGSGLIGAGLYALAGMSGGAAGVWAT